MTNKIIQCKQDKGIRQFPMHDDYKSDLNKGQIVWLFGRPSSGKTTIAQTLNRELNGTNMPCISIDGDELRGGLNKDLGFSFVDRKENLRRAAEMAKIMSLKGFNVVCSFITPTQNDREFVKSLMDGFEFELIYVYAALNTCIKRDVKGLYKKAISGEIVNFTGISAPFDEPENVQLLDTDKNSVSDIVCQLMRILKIPLIKVVNY